MKEILKRFWPVLFIGGLWFVFASPYFLHNKVPYPSKYQVTFFTPWNQYQEFAGPVKNGAMPDIVDQIYPWKHFTIETLKKGQLPLWNPYSFAGNPHLANYQSAVFSPFNLLFFIFPFIDAWSVVVLLQPLLAGLFMYLFLRELKISSVGSVLGSVAFMFCGFMVVWMAYGTLGYAVLWLPLALWSIEKLFSSRHANSKFKIQNSKLQFKVQNYYIWSLLLLLSLPFSFFSGHFQMSLYVAMYVFAYLLFKYFSTKNLRALVWAGSLYLAGIGVSLLQILPTMELYKLAVRSELYYSGGAIPFSYLPTLFAPDFYGNPVTRNDWAGYYAEWASFIGIIPFTLALTALFNIGLRQAQARIMFFFFAALVVLLFTVDTPLQQVLTASKLPIFATSIPSRMIVLFSFSLAVLAGFGLDALVEIIKKRSFKRIILPILLVGLLLAVVLVLAYLLLPGDKKMLAVRNMVLPSAFFFLAAFSSALILIVKKNKVLFLLPILLLAFTAFDSFRFASKWMPFDDKALVFPPLPVIEAMQKHIGQGRVYGDFGAFLDTYYGLAGIDGYDPLYSKRYGEFIQSASEGTFVNAQRSVVSLGKRAKYADRVLDLLGVNLIYHPYSNTDKSWAYPVWEKVEKHELIYKDEKFQLFKNKTALPRAKLFYSYEVIKADKAIIERFYDEQFDFRNVLILEEQPALQQSAISNQQSKNNTKIVSYTPNSVKVSLFTDRPGLLFLSDNYYPTWQVKVNGKEAKIYRADYTFRAVLVPEGKSEVEFFLTKLF